MKNKKATKQVKKYGNVYISPEEMKSAKTDDSAMLSILSKCSLYIYYISAKIYYRRGKLSDPAISIDDINGHCICGLIYAIRHYYHPERYIKRKDKNKIYKDGNQFIFIMALLRGIARNYKYQHDMKKTKIPIENIISLETPSCDHDTMDETPYKGPTISDSISEVDNFPDVDSDLLFIIVSYFNKLNRVVNGVNIRDIALDIMSTNGDYKKIAKKYKMAPSLMQHIIRHDIVGRLGQITLNAALAKTKEDI